MPLAHTKQRTNPTERDFLYGKIDSILVSCRALPKIFVVPLDNRGHIGGAADEEGFSAIVDLKFCEGALTDTIEGALSLLSESVHVLQENFIQCLDTHCSFLSLRYTVANRRHSLQTFTFTQKL